METGKVLVGCVADDFTGASDAASFLAAQGIRTILLNGPQHTLPELAGDTAVVIALKTRSIPADQALEDTRKALDRLDACGADKIYIKYCSTFDSTPAGNIGPIADAAMERYGQRYTLLCPALPVNKRTVRNGELFVDGVPLHQSTMRKHPLNPMWASKIEQLMEPQSRYPCFVLSAKQMQDGGAQLTALLDGWSAAHNHFYLIPDYETEEQGLRIAELFKNQRLFTGGSGFIGCLGACLHDSGNTRQTRPSMDGTKGLPLLLSGSCSAATKAQISHFKGCGGRILEIEPEQLRRGEATPASVLQLLLSDGSTTLVCSAVPEARDSEQGRRAKAKQLEAFMGELAWLALQSGFTRFICAGGETSGAVAQRLGFHAFWIGGSVAPGVPVMQPLENEQVRLVLKSGNFGQEDFFARALEMTGCCQ